MKKVIEVKVVGDYQVWLRFSDASTRVLDLKPYIGDGISSSLLDKEYFKLVRIEYGGGIEWPNGMDFCPNFLFDLPETTKTAKANSHA